MPLSNNLKSALAYLKKEAINQNYELTALAIQLAEETYRVEEEKQSRQDK